MRAVKFCENNLRRTESKEAMHILQRDYSDILKVYETDCFRRCLQCRLKPFCRIQLETIEADNAMELVDKVFQAVNK